jgi:hypothetical protein
MDARQLDEPSQLFEALFEIYNLALAVRNDQLRLESALPRIAKLKTEITTNFKDTFTGTKKTHNDANDGETDTKQSQTNPRNQGGHAGHLPHQLKSTDAQVFYLI